MRTTARTRTLCTLAALALSFLLAAPLTAYTIYLKDGSRLTAKERYTIEGDTAYIVLQSGTRTFIKAAEIDVERTEKANENEYGAAVIIEGGQRRTLEESERLRPQQQRDQRLSDFISQQPSGLRTLPEARRQTEGGPGSASAVTSAGGWADLASLGRRPFHRSEISDELSTYLRGQGLQGARVFQGTRADRPLLELSTASEATVLRALQLSAQALLQVQDRFGDEVKAVEVLMLTPSQERGGQFVLTREMAEDLISRRVEITRFFIDNVQF